MKDCSSYDKWLAEKVCDMCDPERLRIMKETFGSDWRVAFVAKVMGMVDFYESEVFNGK